MSFYASVCAARREAVLRAAALVSLEKLMADQLDAELSARAALPVNNRWDVIYRDAYGEAVFYCRDRAEVSALIPEIRKRGVTVVEIRTPDGRVLVPKDKA